MEDLFFPLPADNSDTFTDDPYFPVQSVREASESAARTLNPVNNGTLELVESFRESPTGADWVLSSWGFMPETDKDAFVTAILETYIDETDDVQSLYMNAFGRLGDPEGLAYWALSMVNSGQDVATLMQPVINTSTEYADNLKEVLGNPDAMSDLQSGEAIEAYVRGLDTETRQAMFGTLLDDLYMNTFGRNADAEGRAYWVGQLETGVASLPDIMGQLLNANEQDEPFLDTKNRVARDATLALVGHGVISSQDISELESGVTTNLMDALDTMEDRLGEYTAVNIPELASDKDSLIDALLREAGVIR